MDYWGFYNGSTNNSLIPTTTVYAGDINDVTYVNGESITNGFMNPLVSWTIGNANREPSETYMKAGILNKITYPTGGYSLFEFEPHRYLSDQYVNQSISKFCGPTYGISRFSKKTEVSNFTYLATGANPSVIPANVTINFSASNMSNTEMGETQMVTLTNTTTNTTLKTWVHEGDLTIPRSVTEQIYIVSGQNYTLKNEVYGPNTVSINSTINWTEKTLQSIPKIGGGLRIKSLKSYSAPNVLAKEENYRYGENESGFGTKLFDERHFYRNYEDIASAYYINGTGGTFGGAGGCAFLGRAWVRNFLGISIYNSINYMGSPILYPTVTKYEGTPTSNIGKTVYNYNIRLNTTVPSVEFISSSPYGSINNAWNQGELISETNFKNQGTQYIPASKKLYEYSSYNHSTETALLFKQTKQQVEFGGCAWSPDGPVGGQGYFSMQEYPIMTGISKKIKETQTVYDQTNPANAVTTVTSFQYQNPANRYMTETSFTTSDGNTNITRIKYPQDMSDVVSTTMVSKNVLTTPLEERKFKSVAGTETLLSTMQTTYKQIGNLLVRDNIKASKGVDAPEPRILFNQYDNDANIIEQQKTGGTSEVFIWGYQKSFPIAKIENATYAQVQPYESNLQTVSDTGTEAALLTALTSLRTSLPNAMVTTYTHIPLVGVSTITDPKGDTITYTYDSFGRLQNVKDKNGNILSENEYHYKN
jgi:YD repeat-containing protein